MAELNYNRPQAQRSKGASAPARNHYRCRLSASFPWPRYTPAGPRRSRTCRHFCKKCLQVPCGWRLPMAKIDSSRPYTQPSGHARAAARQEVVEVLVVEGHGAQQQA